MCYKNGAQACLLCAVLLLCGACAGGNATTAAVSTATATTVHPSTAIPAPLAANVWHPNLVSEWQWQLDDKPIDMNINATVFDIDGLDRTTAEVTALHALAKKVICYIDVGTWESYRADAAQFPASVKGNVVDGFPDERWLDIRQIDILHPIIEARLSECKAKGFDAVEPDNIDGYSNHSGFPLTAHDQLAYDTFIANAVHGLGLSVGLKNDVDQIGSLLPYFDWALDEQCFEYQECDTLTPFIQAGKAVFEVEYNLTTAQFCAQANALDFNSMLKHVALDAYRVPCR